MSTLPDQQTEVHVQLGNGAPAFLPTAIGQHYIDIANRRVYQSVGINSVEDWSVPLATMKDIQELAEALQNNPDVISVLQGLVNDNASAIAALETRVSDIDAEITQTQANTALAVEKINTLEAEFSAARAKLIRTISTSAPSGIPREGEEWIIV